MRRLLSSDGPTIILSEVSGIRLVIEAKDGATDAPFLS